MREALKRIADAYAELEKAWEIDPMGDRYRKADDELDEAISDAVEKVENERR